MDALNDTHDPSRRSWVSGANEPDACYPIQNMPVGVFEAQGRRRGGIAIGDQVLDVQAALETGLFNGRATEAAHAAAQPALNGLMSMGPGAMHELRVQVADLLDTRATRAVQQRVAEILLPASSVRMQLPCAVGDYTDFLTSLHHTQRHGQLKGLADPLPAAFKSLPVAYHGRASSLRVSGVPVRRPWGQWRNPEGRVVFGPTDTLDFELEMAAYVAAGNKLGEPIGIGAAPGQIFGYCLLNDWSAKAIQWWEQVLGPFLGKSFMTSVSPWIVTREALLPFSMPLPPRPVNDPPALEHLGGSSVGRDGLAIQLCASLRTPAMRDAGLAAERISLTEASNMYWSFAQLIAHHTSNGCNLRPGDLLGSGTLSGELPGSMGCMTEMTSAGRTPVVLSNGEKRFWLLDGDEVELSAWATVQGFVSIGFGACSGMVASAHPGT